MTKKKMQKNQVNDQKGYNVPKNSAKDKIVTICRKCLANDKK